MSFGEWKRNKRTAATNRTQHFPPTLTHRTQRSAEKITWKQKSDYKKNVSSSLLPSLSLNKAYVGKVQPNHTPETRPTNTLNLTTNSDPRDIHCGVDRQKYHQQHQQKQQQPKSIAQSSTAEWQNLTDPRSGKVYYSHVASGRTQWTPPREFGKSNQRKRATQSASVKKAPASMILSLAHTAIQHRWRLLLNGMQDLEWIQASVLENQRQIQSTLSSEASELRREIEAREREASEPDVELMNALANLSMLGNMASDDNDDEDENDGFALFAGLQNIFQLPAKDKDGKQAGNDDG